MGTGGSIGVCKLSVVCSMLGVLFDPTGSRAQAANETPKEQNAGIPSAALSVGTPFRYGLHWDVQLEAGLIAFMLTRP